MATAARAAASQYLSFTLGEEVFALDIAKVREVLDHDIRITEVPRMPEFMRGVINLRGGVVPVVDMRRRFGMGETRRSVNTCIVIVEVEVNGETTVLGALADAVKEVFELDGSDIEPAPRIGSRLDTRILKGVGKRDGEFLLMLDIDEVFSGEEMLPVIGAGNEAPPLP